MAKSPKSLEEAKALLKSWEIWASAMQIHILRLVDAKKLSKYDAYVFIQLLDWDVLPKTIEREYLTEKLKDIAYGKQI